MLSSIQRGFVHCIPSQRAIVNAVFLTVITAVAVNMIQNIPSAMAGHTATEFRKKCIQLCNDQFKCLIRCLPRCEGDPRCGEFCAEKCNSSSF